MWIGELLVNQLLLPMAFSTFFIEVTSTSSRKRLKGGDYSVDQIAGAKEVIANGGRVVINPILEGFSTTSIIEAAKKK